jgi:hypothetical protein
VAVIIVAGVAVVAMGRGGEMARFTADIRPLDADIETAADVALLRPPAAMWGYDKRATDEALNAVAQTVTDRDVEIATLRQQLADLQDPRPQQAARSPGAGQPEQAVRGAAAGQPERAVRSAAAGLPEVPAPPASPEQTPPAAGPDTGSWSAWERSHPARPADEPAQEESG